MGNVEETLVGSMLVILTENKTGLQTVSRTCGTIFFHRLKKIMKGPFLKISYVKPVTEHIVKRVNKINK